VAAPSICRRHVKLPSAGTIPFRRAIACYSVRVARSRSWGAGNVGSLHRQLFCHRTADRWCRSLARSVGRSASESFSVRHLCFSTSRTCLPLQPSVRPSVRSRRHVNRGRPPLRTDITYFQRTSYILRAHYSST